MGRFGSTYRFMSHMWQHNMIGWLPDKIDSSIIINLTKLNTKLTIIMNVTYKCSLCQQNFSSRNKLLTHEGNKHRNNKVIPHRTSLCLLSFELLVYYQDTIIVLIKKWLGFNRHSIGSKWLSINAFPETIFVHLFESKPTFWYSLVKQKYFYQFQKKIREEKLKQILNYKYWNFRQDSKTNTIGYVLFVNYKRIYKVNFS